MAAVLVLAGCSGAAPGGTADPAADDDGTLADGETPIGGSSGDGGTVTFYISDEENAIDDFEHLNVTVTKVGLHRTGDVEDDDETATATETPNTTGTALATTAETEAAEADEEDEADEADGEGDAEWVEYEVNRTVDLTELKGANATKLDVLAAPNGTYDKVFVHVDGIDATLKNGESVNVKLPSNKLQINKGFAIGDGEAVSFVFDLSVHEAGNSGKYILKPVIGESGTSDEVDIEDVDEDDEDDEDEREEDDDRDDEEADDRDDEAETEEEAETENESETESESGDATAELTAEFQGPVRAGEDATLKVTGADGPVANASVAVDGEDVGTTDDAGTITFAVPADAEELEVEVTKGDAELELTRDLGGGNSLLRVA